MSNKNIEVGDKVRFLDEVGGGIVARIEGNLLLIEDEDGFEIPFPNSKVVLVEKKSKETSTSEDDSFLEVENYNIDVSEKEPYHHEAEEESRDDMNPRFYLAFTQELDEDSSFHLHLVNDSNYYVAYLVSNLDEEQFRFAKYQGVIEPNTKLSIGSMAFHELNIALDFQLILFKKGQKYPNIEPVSSTVYIKPNKILKENSFSENDFFHQRAVLLPIIKNELEKKIEELSQDDIEKAIKEKEKRYKPKQFEKRNQNKEILEIDLHIHELVENVSGLSNGEILQLQLDRFSFVMDNNLSNKGKKIVFIHGVGNGILKTEIRNLLERKYKHVSYQDASFKEYGFGATMVII